MNKHTPGPWSYTVDSDGDNFKLTSGDTAIIAGCGCCGSPFMHGQDHKADADLIVVAPELLAMLEYVQRRIEDSDAWWMNCPDRGGFDADAIDDLIAKAKGEK